jgi:hypothetical protein
MTVQQILDSNTANKSFIAKACGTYNTPKGKVEIYAVKDVLMSIYVSINGQEKLISADQAFKFYADFNQYKEV